MGSRVLHRREQEDATGPFADRFSAILDRLEGAGIAIPADRSAAAGRYVRLRQEWKPKILALGRAMLYTPHDINPTDAALPGEREIHPFSRPVRSAH